MKVRLAKLWNYASIAWGWRTFLLYTMAWTTASAIVRPFFGEALTQKMMRRYFRGVLRILGIELDPRGTAWLTGASPCVLVANHNSLLDIPCLGVLFDFDYKWVSKKEIFRIPFVGWHLRAGGHLWVDRSRRDNAARLEREFQRLLGRGSSILIFPEGTRSPDGALRAFRRGAFETAVRQNVPVLPIALDGTEKLLEKGSLRFPGRNVRKRVGVAICPPIHPDGDREGSVEDRAKRLRDRTHAEIAQALADLREAPTQAAV